MKKSVTILDLFAGYGGAELSFKYAEIDVKKSYISEINPSALKVLEHHYPNAVFVGDVGAVVAVVGAVAHNSVISIAQIGFFNHCSGSDIQGFAANLAGCA